MAGVRVGQIDGTSQKNGQGVLHMSIDPSKLPHVYRDARADLVPNTPLKDMQVNVYPALRRRAVPHGLDDRDRADHLARGLGRAARCARRGHAR